jgi:hypothetical protein
VSQLAIVLAEETRCWTEDDVETVGWTRELVVRPQAWHGIVAEAEQQIGSTLDFPMAAMMESMEQRLIFRWQELLATVAIVDQIAAEFGGEDPPSRFPGRPGTAKQIAEKLATELASSGQRGAHRTPRRTRCVSCGPCWSERAASSAALEGEPHDRHIVSVPLGPGVYRCTDSLSPAMLWFASCRHPTSTIHWPC